jgi:hypothetical protein
VLAMTETMPTMSFNRDGQNHQPLKTFQVNGNTVLAVYKGSLSDYDILIKYRQKLPNGKWSAIRTPKHIHWTVDILLKMQTYKQLTEEFLDFCVATWNNTKPILSEQERNALDLDNILNINAAELEKFKALSTKGEYSVRFLILLAKLLMIQEKTNRPDAYMFHNVLAGLRRGEDLFRVLSSATLGANRR